MSDLTRYYTHTEKEMSWLYKEAQTQSITHIFSCSFPLYKEIREGGREGGMERGARGGCEHGG